MEKLIDIINKSSIESFSSNLTGVLNDFYYKTYEHMTNTCMNILRNKYYINDIDIIYPTMENFCKIIFNFTVSNIKWIKEKGLWYPSKVYSGYIYLAENEKELMFALKSIKIILDDYEVMRNMDIEEIEESRYFKYIFEHR